MILVKTLSYIVAFYLKEQNPRKTQQQLFSEAFKEASIDIAKTMGYTIDEWKS